MKPRTYLEIIKFCGNLSFSKLKAFKEMYRLDKNKEFLIATEVLKIKTKQLIERRA
ncbi:MAG: hypothetical protein VX347_03625 [Bacteroidota bacterium]|nr:hypothetical protein [Bacteroidota bacterium]